MPILGHIPLLGLLFRNYDTDNRVTDFYAFITPTVVGSRSDARQLEVDIREAVDGFDAMIESVN